ncbi:ankyrin repeat-containing domain protein [Aspergillus californicus]
MPLLCLPTELVICIAENFELASDILRLATTNNQLFCILLPVLYRFNVQQQNSSALLWSAKSGNPKVAETMIHEYKADVSAVHEHNTPLIWAAIHGSVSVVKILLRAPGISVNFRNHKRETALWWAANHGYTSIVEELLREKDIEIDCQDTSYGLTPLAAAACYGHAEITRQLLATGRVDIHKQNRLHQTPIFLAILNRNEEVMQTLLDEKALDLACQDNVGRNLLSVAALKGQISVVKTLLRKGVAVNTVDHQGQSGSIHRLSLREATVLPNHFLLPLREDVLRLLGYCSTTDLT